MVKAERLTDRGDAGAAAVEFALVATLFVTLLLGIIAFGFALFRMQSAQHGAREGARLAAVGVNDCAQFQQEVAERGKGAGIDADAVTLTYDDLNGGGPGSGDSVTVDVPYEIDLSVLGFLGLGTVTGTQSGTARVEQVGTVTSC
jgi:hypothetical protein